MIEFNVIDETTKRRLRRGFLKALNTFNVPLTIQMIQVFDAFLDETVEEVSNEFRD